MLQLVSPAGQALPDLSEPNDVISTDYVSNTVEILNTQDNSILQCEIISGLLQNCKSMSVQGLNSPYRGVALYPWGESKGWVYVAAKNSNTIVSYPTNSEGRISNNVQVATVPFQPLEGEDSRIIDIQGIPYPSFSPKSKSKPWFYLSKTTGDSDNHYGQVLILHPNKWTAGIDSYHVINNLDLPLFRLVGAWRFTNAIPLVGAGHVDGDLTASQSLFPFYSLLEPDNGLLKLGVTFGGKDASLGVISPDAFSIDMVAYPYASITPDSLVWISYKNQNKFAKYRYWRGWPEALDSYQALNNSHVTFRNIFYHRGASEAFELFHLAAFADDNKIGICHGGGDFECTDAFRYLDTVFSINGSNAIPKKSFSSNSLSDRGSVTFRNLNYSPLNESEVQPIDDIPESLAPAFSGSCLEPKKVDFTAKSDEVNVVEDTCSLNFDFGLLNNAEPIRTSFDATFSVIGPFGARPTTFHFNLDLPISQPHFLFEKNGEPLTDLNLIAGDSGTIDVTYFDKSDVRKPPEINFLTNGNNSDLLRSYFANTGCLSSPKPELSSGQHCVLSYHIPVNATDNQNFQLQLVNSDNIPNQAVNISLASAASVVANDPYTNHSINTLHHIKFANLQPDSSTRIRFTNVGAAMLRNFSVSFAQLIDSLPISLTGSCTTHPNLSAQGGSCDLTISLDGDTNVHGKYQLHISGDGYSGYDFPITIGAFPFDKGIGVSNGHTGLLGPVSIFQTAQGYLKVTNYAGYRLNDLTVTLPELNLSPQSAQPNSSIFYEVTDGEFPSCFQGSGAAGAYHTQLDPLASCEIAYRVNQGVVAGLQDAIIQFDYQREGQNTQLKEEQAIHLTNENAVAIDNKQGGKDISSIDIDASQPSMTLAITNHSGYSINNLIVTTNASINEVVDSAACQNQSLQEGESCDIRLTLKDNNPLIGKYKLTIDADNLQQRVVSFVINKARTDNVEIDNHGIYVMNVDYTGYHPNTNGLDDSCQSGACYANTSTGWFTNPFSKTITGVSGRNITLYMMAGTSVTLKSCNGGKIVCTGTTFDPQCRYSDDADEDPCSQLSTQQK